MIYVHALHGHPSIIFVHIAGSKKLLNTDMFLEVLFKLKSYL